MSLDQAVNELKDRTDRMVDEWKEIVRLFDRAADGLRSFVEVPTDFCPDCERVVKLVNLKCGECGYDFINEKSI